MRLAELERKTHPKDGAQSATKKDLAAFEALDTAGQLVEALAGWALDHQMGLALKGLKFVPLGTAKTRSLPEYQQARSLVDDHQHEVNGGMCNIDGEVARRMLINLLRANPGGFNITLQLMTIAALEARDYDETLSMLAPTKVDRKVDLTTLKLQMRALQFVEYRHGRGMKKFKAQEEVSGALGVSAETIRSWEKRLRAEFGQLEVTRTLSFAYNHGTMSFMSGSWDAQPGGRDWHYGSVALQELAQQYRKAMRLKTHLS
jgi:hypothetical protein